MKKTVKRILAVILLVLVVLLVGCFLYTGNRLASYPNKIESYDGAVFDGKDNTIVAFKTTGTWYGTADEEVILLEITDYTEGVITMKKNNIIYRFVAIDENTIYDENTKQLLTRRGADG